MNNLREIELLEEYTLLAYADDIVIHGESKAELTTSTFNLLKSRKNMGLQVNEIKTICYEKADSYANSQQWRI